MSRPIWLWLPGPYTQGKRKGLSVLSLLFLNCKKVVWVWTCMSLITPKWGGGRGKEDHEFRVSPSYTWRACLQKYICTGWGVKGGERYVAR